MLEQIFLKVMDMSRTASIIIAAVFVVRILLKRFPCDEAVIKKLGEARRKTKKGVLAALIAGVIVLIVCFASTRKGVIAGADDPGDKRNDEISDGISDEISGEISGEISDERNDDPSGEIDEEIKAAENEEIPDESAELEPLQVSLDITEHYIMHKGDPSNLYHIDENHVLWGCGRNDYGQLGQGTRDDDFHEDMVKIAENVIHVDYSQRGFVIFLTENHRLYGMGNAAAGALQQYSESDWINHVNGDRCYVSEPYLLAVNVMYACCGRDDVVCLKEDGTVWTWGTIYTGYFLARPKKVFEGAVLVTGGWYHHAALLSNGTVWTWGYNGAGNCGVADLAVVSEPTMVAEDVVMVWTDLAVDADSWPDAEDIAMAWRGDLKYTEHDTIAEYDGWYPRHLNNTVIRKADGSYWVCGENVGTEEKMVQGEEGAYPVICTHEFYPCE